jgi:Ca-activated chloride channel family protein
MEWLWPEFLFLLGLIPLLILLYIWILRRRRRFAVRFSSLMLVRQAAPRHSWLRRHLPFAFFLAALAGLVLAFARPVTIASLPMTQNTIILTLDVSRSMLFADVQPSRLAAAKEAAISFVKRQSPSTLIGIVAFSGYAQVILPPTNDQTAVEAAIQSLTTARATAIGSGILKSLDAISEIDPSVPPSASESSPGIEPTPPPKDQYAPEIVVLLTDGVSNAGPPPLEAAQQAVNRGVRVYTIGFGTANGPNANQFGGAFGNQQFGGNGGGGQFGGGNGGQFGGFRRGIDEVTLKEVANMTGADYYPAAGADELNQVFQKLPTNLITRREVTEISVAFAAIGAFCAALAIGLSMLWHPLP